MSYLQQLHETMKTYRLDRFPRGKMIATRLQMTPVSEDEAYGFLMFLSPLIDQQMNNPNLLHPAPDEQQLEKLGRPDIEFLTLENGLRAGLKVSDGPRHIACFGRTGSGKTTCIRKIIELIDQEVDRE